MHFLKHYLYPRVACLLGFGVVCDVDILPIENMREIHGLLSLIYAISACTDQNLKILVTEDSCCFVSFSHWWLGNIYKKQK